MSGDFTLRAFRPGDEVQIADLFNRSVAAFLGPFAVTPESWRAQYRRRTWRGPGIEEDPECIYVAERDGRLLGHCVTDYGKREQAQIMELCVREGDEAVAEALVQDAEARAPRPRQVVANHASSARTRTHR